jgi:hypothetical protein
MMKFVALAIPLLLMLLTDCLEAKAVGYPSSWMLPASGYRKIPDRLIAFLAVYLY